MCHRYLIAVGVLIFLVSICLGQSFVPGISPYFTNPDYDALIDYAVNTGQVTLNYYLTQPYCTQDLRNAFADLASPLLKNWSRSLLNDVSRFCRPDSIAADLGSWIFGVNGSLHSEAQSSETHSRSRAEVYGVYSLPYVVLANRTVIDQRFKQDPDYYGDTGEWIYGRVEDAYLQFKVKSLSVFAGRLSRNFGFLRVPGLVLSKNPYSYDLFGFQIGARRMRFSFYATRLDDMKAFDSQAKEPVVQNCKRYFSVQRADFIFSERLQIALTEAVVYGGAAQTLESVYLNPLNLYYVDQRNQTVQMNGLWALDIFWKPLHKVSLYNQVLIDDVIVNNDAGQDDRAQHPDRMGISSRLCLADCGVPGWQASLAYARLGNWTYMSYRTWENYIYHNKSMGYPENSVESIEMLLDYFRLYPFHFNLRFAVQRRGQQDLTQVFGDRREKFPMGVVETSRCVDFSVNCLSSHLYHVSLGCGFQSLDNAEHVNGRNTNSFHGFVALSVSPSFQFVF